MTLQHVEVPDRLRSAKRKVPEPLKATARRVLREYGMRTATRRQMPDFLIIGTKRGGTTSLWNYLLRHDDVLPMFPPAQQIKSPHYFDVNFWRGEQWYRSHFPTGGQRQRAQRRTGVAPVAGEASPYYMFHPLAPQRVSDAVPDVKLIVMLRDPVTRAYSNYNERRGSGVEPLLTFEEALAAEEERLTGEAARIWADPRYASFAHDNWSYLARGRYLEHLGPWLDMFSREQILVLLTEDLQRDAAGPFRQVCDFLQIRPQGLEAYPRHNYLPVSSMAPRTRAWLTDYYRPHNRALAERLGRELPWPS